MTPVLRPDPPALANRLIARSLGEERSEAVIGDLAELHAVRRAERGVLRAGLWYWRQAAWIVLWMGRGDGRPAAPVRERDGFASALLADLRHGARGLIATPGFSLAAMLTLALAIGANTVIFSFVNILLLRPLPVQEPDRLGWVAFRNPQTGSDRWPISLPELSAFGRAPAFQSLGGRQARTYTLSARGEVAQRVLGNVVTGDLQGIWGLRTTHGRRLGSRDERPGAQAVVSLSHRFWARHFGSRPSVVGESLVLDGQPHQVVGIMSPEMELGNLAEIDLWVAYRGDPALAPRTDRSWRVTGRLARGATVADAHAQVEAIGRQLEQEFAETNRHWRPYVADTRRAMVGDNAWLVLSMLGTVVTLLLVLACANVTNMLLARLTTRRQEFAIRSALGATNGRLIRQLITEALVLGLAGAAVGLGLGWAGLRVMRAAAYEPIFEMITIDRNVLAFAIALALVAPILFALLPAVSALRGDPKSGLGEGGARTIGGRARRQRAALVVAQLTLAVTLLGAAGLVVRTMVATIRVDPGFETGGLLTWSLDVPAWKYPNPADVSRVHERLLDRLRTLEGAAGVASVTTLPAVAFEATSPFDIEGRVTSSPDNRPWASVSVASADFWRVAGIRLLAGRLPNDRDREGAPGVVVISREAARRYWGSTEAAIAARVTLAGDGARAGWQGTVVGVVADTANPNLERGPSPHLFFVHAQHPVRQIALLLRAGHPDGMAAQVRRAIYETDPDLAIYKLRTVEDAIRDEQSSNYIMMSLFIAFAIVAVLLAASGLYGVMAFAVTQRAQEIALRMTLGASRADIGRHMFGEGLRLTTVGLGLGLAGAVALGHAMASVLFGVTPTDLPTYAGVVAATLLAILPAVWIPTRRAIRVDPIITLRQA